MHYKTGFIETLTKMRQLSFLVRINLQHKVREVAGVAEAKQLHFDNIDFSRGL